MKRLLQVGLLLVLVLVLALAIAGAYLNSFVKSGVETYGPNITGTTVTLEKADLSVLFGRGRLEGLVVGNPPGFQAEHAFASDMIEVRVDLPSAWAKTLVIDEIILDRPEITFEGGLGDSNIRKIRRNVEAFSARRAATATPVKAGQEPPARERKVRINHLRVRNATVTLRASPLGGSGVTIPLPDIHLKDLGKKSGGATVQEVSAQVFAALYLAIVQAVSSSSAVLKQGVGQAEQAVRDVGGAAGEAASKAAEGLKGLFSE